MTPHEANQELWTVDEAAAYLKVSAYTIREWLKHGKLKGKKLPGGQWRVPRTEVIQ